MLYKLRNRLFFTIVLTVLCSTVAQAQIDTSEYGAWDDILSPQQAKGRFEWLTKCHKGILAETWDRMFDPTELISDDDKVERLRQIWLFKNDAHKLQPNYLTFGDIHHKNTEGWQAGTDHNEPCRTIPINYSIVGLLTSFDFKSYCTMHSQHAEFEWIANVEFGDFVSNSGPRTYTNFSGRIINVLAGQVYSLKLTPGFDGKFFFGTWRVWGDWNNDGDFNDEGELILEYESQVSETNELTVPENAVKGFSKMRVAMNYLGGNNAPCRDFQYGEVEDYVLLIK